MQILVDNFIIHYEIFGASLDANNSTILFLPGWGRTLSDFNLVRELLGQKLPRATLIQLDLPGFGGSSLEKKDGMTITEYADLIKNFLEKIGAPRAALIGHSFGAKVAVKFGALFPERAEKLVLISAAGLSQKTIKVRLAAFGSPFIRLFLFSFQYTKWVRRMTYAFRRLFESSDYRATHSPALRETLKKNVSESSRKDAEKIACPALIIWGKDDVVTPLKDGRLYHAVIRNSKFVIFAECGHFPFLKYPEKCADAIFSFLRNST